MNKADLIKLLGETDLAPEALAEIAVVLDRHRKKTHDGTVLMVEAVLESIDVFEQKLVTDYNKLLEDGGDFTENERTKHFNEVTAHIGPNGKVFLTPSLKFRDMYPTGEMAYYFSLTRGNKLQEYRLRKPTQTILEDFDLLKNARRLPNFDFQKGELI